MVDGHEMYGHTLQYLGAVLSPANHLLQKANTVCDKQILCTDLSPCTVIGINLGQQKLCLVNHVHHVSG
jgi:hypothetical protein